MGELAPAQSRFEESLVLLRDLGDQQGTALALINVLVIERLRGYFSSAAIGVEEALVLVRELGNKAESARCVSLLGETGAEHGAFDSARAMLNETMDIRLAMGEAAWFRRDAGVLWTSRL